MIIRHSLSRRELLPGNIQGGRRYTCRLVERHLHRPGDPQPPAISAGDGHSLRLARIRRPRAQPGRHMEPNGLRRRQQAGGADRRSLPDVRETLWPDEGSREHEERARRASRGSGEGGHVAAVGGSADPGRAHGARPHFRKGTLRPPGRGVARGAGARTGHCRAERPHAEDQPDADRAGGLVAGRHFSRV